jgi:hypothetical protein
MERVTKNLIQFIYQPNGKNSINLFSNCNVSGYERNFSEFYFSLENKSFKECEVFFYCDYAIDTIRSIFKDYPKSRSRIRHGFLSEDEVELFFSEIVIESMRIKYK